MGFKSDLLCGDFTEKQEISSILRANEKTSQYGLVLTKEQAAALAQTRVSSLKNSGRIEFKGGTVDKIILAFCDSPYISPQNYEETLHRLIGLFYDFKCN
ncbi:MAG: DUF6323 family protein [Oscillospiraceae bacterium]